MRRFRLPEGRGLPSRGLLRLGVVAAVAAIVASSAAAVGPAQVVAAATDTARSSGFWTAVAQSMRDNASAMEKLVATKRAIPPEKTTAVDDLKTYQEFTEVRLDGLKHLTSAFKSLYDAMTPEQKKNADMVFEKYTPSKPASQG